MYHIWYSQSVLSSALTCAIKMIKCTYMRQNRFQSLWLPTLVVCSLRTSETNYLSESFSFYSAIRMRAYYSKANKEERWDIFISYDTAIASFSSEHILKVHLSVWSVHLAEHWLSNNVSQVWPLVSVGHGCLDEHGVFSWVSDSYPGFLCQYEAQIAIGDRAYRPFTCASFGYCVGPYTSTT